MHGLETRIDRDTSYRIRISSAEIAPHGAWNWCWLGQAAQAIGEQAEARTAYERAIALEDEGEDETEARELLDELSGT